MKKHKLLLVAALTLVAKAALAVPFTETGDAGSLVGTAQSVGTGVTSISGATDGNDSEDLYSFYWGGGLFEAATNGTFGSSRNFDTMLFLFDGNGVFITVNDDTSGPNGSLGSFISATLVADNYLLGISGWPNDALNGSGSSFRDGATGTLTSWDGGGGIGTYTIGLNSATSASAPEPVASVPEPTTLALLGLGLAGLGFVRKISGLRSAAV